MHIKNPTTFNGSLFSPRVKAKSLECSEDLKWSSSSLLSSISLLSGVPHCPLCYFQLYQAYYSSRNEMLALSSMWYVLRPDIYIMNDSLIFLKSLFRVTSIKTILINLLKTTTTALPPKLHTHNLLIWLYFYCPCPYHSITY